MKDQTEIKSLSIALIGVGKIGSLFAYQLARSGHDVTLIARPESMRLGQLKRDKGIILQSGEYAETDVTDQLDEKKAYDLVIVTLLAKHVDAILPALKRSKANCIHFVFVNFEPEHLQNAIGRDRCTFGMPFVTASLDEDGKLKPRIGKRKTLHSDTRWVDLFNNVGIPSALESNMLLWLRCHAPFAIAMENISFAGQRHNGGATWTEAFIVSRGLHGCFKIIEGLGYEIYPGSKVWLNKLPIFLMVLMLWLTSRVKPFRVLLSQGIDEARFLTDNVLEVAAKSNDIFPGFIQAVHKTKDIQQ